MSDFSALAELEEAHDKAAAAARHRIQDAEDHLFSYRSALDRLQEDFHNHASQRGYSHDDGFRSALQRVSDEAEQNVRDVTGVIAELEDDLYALLSRQDEERERFLRG